MPARKLSAVFIRDNQDLFRSTSTGHQPSTGGSSPREFGGPRSRRGSIATEPESPGPRCLSRDAAAEYLSVSADMIDRLIHTGKLQPVRLPTERSRHTGRGKVGMSRRVLIDRRDLDQLIEDSKLQNG